MFVAGKVIVKRRESVSRREKSSGWKVEGSSVGREEGKRRRDLGLGGVSR